MTAAWIDPAAKKPPRPMKVVVTLECGQVVKYDALFAHVFDGYDHAMRRYPKASRVEVIDLQAQALKEARHAA